MTDFTLSVAWKQFARFHPQIFEVENLIALRIIGCGLTGALQQQALLAALSVSCM
jgi:hypothetical protein